MRRKTTTLGVLLASLMLVAAATSATARDKCTIVGDDGPNDFGDVSGNEVVCGLGNNDTVGTLSAGAVFYGGDDHDRVEVMEDGAVFIGGSGWDRVNYQTGGTFDGGAGNDSVKRKQTSGVFDGGPGDDQVVTLDTYWEDNSPVSAGTFYGGPGDDHVVHMWASGDAGIDTAFYGGNGKSDEILHCYGFPPRVHAYKVEILGATIAGLDCPARSLDENLVHLARGYAAGAAALADAGGHIAEE